MLMTTQKLKLLIKHCGTNWNRASSSKVQTVKESNMIYFTREVNYSLIKKGEKAWSARKKKENIKCGSGSVDLPRIWSRSQPFCFIFLF